MTKQYSAHTQQMQMNLFSPTFRRAGTSTTADYLFLHPIQASATIEVMHHRDWTDHALLSVTLRFDNPDYGRRIWRANPKLAKNSYFVQQLTIAPNKLHTNLARRATSPAVQSFWDDIK